MRAMSSDLTFDITAAFSVDLSTFLLCAARNLHTKIQIGNIYF